MADICLFTTYQNISDSVVWSQSRKRFDKSWNPLSEKKTYLKHSTLNDFHTKIKAGEWQFPTWIKV